MPDLGKYALEVALAYGATGLLLIGLVGLSLMRARKVTRQLTKAEARRHG